MKKNSFRHAGIALCAASLLLSSFVRSAPAQQPPEKKLELTVDSIMRGPRLVGYAPSGVYWSQDSQRVYFRWKQPDEPRLKEPSLYVVNRDGTGLRRLTDEEARQAPPANGELSKDKTMTVFVDEGDVFLYDHVKGIRRQITRTTDVETNAHFTFDQKRIYFTRANNLYVMGIDDGSLTQMTDIRPFVMRIPGVAGAQTAGGQQSQQNQVQNNDDLDERQRRGTDSQEYLKKEERGLLDAVRERAEQREEQEKKRKEREKRKPYRLALRQVVISLTLSPDDKSVVALFTDQPEKAKNTVVPNYVTESAYTEDIPGRTKVGDTLGRTRLLLISTETGETRTVDHGQRLAEPSALTSTQNIDPKKGVSALNTQEDYDATETTEASASRQRAEQSRDRDVQLSPPVWSDDGRNAVLLARSADNKDRWIMWLDPATGKTKVLVANRDDAWVGGPGANTLGWLPDNTTVYFESERDGWAHLYSVSKNGGEIIQLTSGKFEVSEVRLSPDKKKFYFTSSEGSFFERHLYSMAFAGGQRTRITALTGNNQAEVSPDDSLLADIRSYSNRPPELYLVTNGPMEESKAAALKPVTTSPIPEFFTHDWIDPPIASFKAHDGATVYGRIYIPTNWKRGGPAVLFVHGAGYLQNVHRWWSQYYREYMFHHLLMENGFLVFDIDYRGSAGYGRDWRVGIYRHMGGKDLSDHVDAVNYLIKEHGVDPKRVGLYGGSYGGFITLMALFTEPDVFAAGAALRPVTDWAHYNNGYTSNILNLPQADAEAYKQSSPIYFAAGLKGALLICHGMVDTNVNFQDTVRLVEKLIELRKENWQVAPYPVEDHGFDREASWADEYKRIYKLFKDNLRPETRRPKTKR
ncbi:MAG TPA: prolyl oligopeptidase family serine peptidase [Pyrinomonadaceae bacterium]|nr:prolyl oligopeptidase family serine peptidase [Pyrinomonadaceae bacterium]